MRDSKAPTVDPRGAGLVVTMLVLLFITLLAASFMQNIRIEDRIPELTPQAGGATEVAAAGIAEVAERIRQGDIPDDEDPRMVAQIFLSSPSAVPVCGQDTVALATWQSGQMMPYSTTEKGPDVLTVRYKTDAGQRTIYRYDPSRHPSIQTASGQPIFVIRSTGRTANARTTVVTEMIRQPLHLDGTGAAVGRARVQTRGDVYLCGYNHHADTPEWTSSTAGRNRKSGSCNEYLEEELWELSSGPVAGAWSQAKFVTNLAGGQWGSPDIVEDGGPCPESMRETLGLSAAEFRAVMGTPFTDDSARGLFGARHFKPASGTLVVTGGKGDGLMYVEGDLRIGGTFTYRGLICATGNIVIDGHAWILGSVVAGGMLRCSGAKKSVTVLYSEDAIVQNLAPYASRFTPLSWREMKEESTPRLRADRLRKGLAGR